MKCWNGWERRELITDQGHRSSAFGWHGTCYTDKHAKSEQHSTGETSQEKVKGIQRGQRRSVITREWRWRTGPSGDLGKEEAWWCCRGSSCWGPAVSRPAAVWCTRSETARTTCPSAPRSSSSAPILSSCRYRRRCRRWIRRRESNEDADNAARSRSSDASRARHGHRTATASTGADGKRSRAEPSGGDFRRDGWRRSWWLTGVGDGSWSWLEQIFPSSSSCLHLQPPTATYLTHSITSRHDT